MLILADHVQYIILHFPYDNSTLVCIHVHVYTIHLQCISNATNYFVQEPLRLSRGPHTVLSYDKQTEGLGCVITTIVFIYFSMDPCWRCKMITEFLSNHD